MNSDDEFSVLDISSEKLRRAGGLLVDLIISVSNLKEDYRSAYGHTRQIVQVWDAD